MILFQTFQTLSYVITKIPFGLIMKLKHQLSEKIDCITGKENLVNTAKV